MPEIGVVNLPPQLEVPAPSVAVPKTGKDTVVPATDPEGELVRMIGEPANTEQESPGASPAQFVFADPGPAPVMK